MNSYTNDDVKSLRVRYLRQLARYRDPPRGIEDKRFVVHQLASLEHELLEKPPLIRNPSTGIWEPRKKGLITWDEVRAKATSEGLSRLAEFQALPKVPRIRDDFKLIPENEWEDAIKQKEVDQATMRPLIKLQLDQDGVGSCASEGYSGCIQGLEEKQLHDVVELLNPWALYGLVNGGADNGSSLIDNVVAGAKYGVPTQKVWSRSHSWREKLSDEAKQDALRHRVDEYWRVGSKQEFGTALLLGMLVYAGYSGHAWFAVDLIDNVRFLWKNSWGRDWGDDGFSTLQFSSVAWGYGCYAMRTTIRPTTN